MLKGDDAVRIACSTLMIPTLLAMASCCGCSDSGGSSDPAPIAKARELERAVTETTDPEESDGDDAQASAAAAGESRTATFEGITFTIPDGWEEVELSDMQRGIIAAKYRIPAAGPDVTLTCSSVGGGIAANIDRWKGQFSGSEFDTEDINVGGNTATLVDLRGRFSPGFGREPQANWRMLGVAIPAKPREFYLKLTGPREAVGEIADEFREFTRSGRLTD